MKSSSSRADITHATHNRSGFLACKLSLPMLCVRLMLGHPPLCYLISKQSTRRVRDSKVKNIRHLSHRWLLHKLLLRRLSSSSIVRTQSQTRITSKLYGVTVYLLLSGSAAQATSSKNDRCYSNRKWVHICERRTSWCNFRFSSQPSQTELLPY